MSWGRGKSEKGSGGKLGQSGKQNRLTHQEEKEIGRRVRRLDDKRLKHEAKKASSGKEG